MSDSLDRFEEHLRSLVKSEELYRFLIAGIRAKELVLDTIELGMLVGPSGDLLGWLAEMQDVLEAGKNKVQGDFDTGLDNLLTEENQ